MQTTRCRLLLGVCALALVLVPACAPDRRPADLGAIYSATAQGIGDDRVPVLVLPGILGSKLEEDASGQQVWGSFTFGAADADTPGGARSIALPMARGVPLRDLRDGVVPTEALDVVIADVAIFRGIEIGAYVDIMRTLAVGKYRDETLGESGAIDYGGLHYTCYQFAYDWRRDVSENARVLHGKVIDAQRAARAARAQPDDTPVKVDVVAHSMGGLVLRYYLRYGTQPLPDDGTLPELTWAGAQNVSRAILVGTPNAGSIHALQRLIDGLDLSPLFPNYRPAVLGTMPAIYQLLPRTRHARVIDAETGEPLDLLDARVWQRYGWGLASEDQDRMLRWLLPDAATPEERRAIAFDHLTKCLARADQLFRALDREASPPEGTEIHLFAGDGEPTAAVAQVDARGRVTVIEKAPGDDTVTRASALMDERIGAAWTPGLRSPVDWDRVQFLFEDHLGLTRSPEFVDNMLYLLLEEPR